MRSIGREETECIVPLEYEECKSIRNNEENNSLYFVYTTADEFSLYGRMISIDRSRRFLPLQHIVTDADVEFFYSDEIFLFFFAKSSDVKQRKCGALRSVDKVSLLLDCIFFSLLSSTPYRSSGVVTRQLRGQLLYFLSRPSCWLLLTRRGSSCSLHAIASADAAVYFLDPSFSAVWLLLFPRLLLFRPLQPGTLGLPFFIANMTRIGSLSFYSLRPFEFPCIFSPK